MCQPTFKHKHNQEEEEVVEEDAATIHTSFLHKPPAIALLSLAFAEARAVLQLALPVTLAGLLLYFRSLLSMLFLGRLGPHPLAGGALAIAFANITGYSVLSGLASALDPLCSQAFGAANFPLLVHSLQQSVLLLLAASLPISLLWLSMRRLLLLAGQDPAVAIIAHHYILFSLPDLVLHSLLLPLRIFLRSQSIITPLTLSSAIALVLHLPFNYLFVSLLRLSVKGVALAGVCTNVTLLIFLLSYVFFSGIHARTGALKPSVECFKRWQPLLSLAVPCCVSVCLEWWWYELMLLLCGFLRRPSAAIAAMGILIQTTSLIYIFPSSLSYAVSTRVGNALGANRPDRARCAATIGLLFGFALGFAAVIFACSVRNIWAGMFTDDATITALATAALPVLGACELGNCPQTAGCGALRGSARPRAAASINICSFYVLGAPAAAGLAFWGAMGFTGLWLGLLVAQASCLVHVLFVIRRTNWARQAERAQRLAGVTGEGVLPVVGVPEIERKGCNRESGLVLGVEIQQQVS